VSPPTKEPSAGPATRPSRESSREEKAIEATIESAIESAIETPAETAAQIAAQVAAHISAQMGVPSLGQTTERAAPRKLVDAPAATLRQRQRTSSGERAAASARDPAPVSADSLAAAALGPEASADSGEDAGIRVAGDAQAALGLATIVRGPEDDSNVPVLPLDVNEPPPRSRLTRPPAGPDLPGLETLRQLAGPDPERARQALCAALAGGSYDPRALPGVRAMLLGIARMMIAHGVDLDVLADSIIEAMQE
jgi:hypothetical protein